MAASPSFKHWMTLELCTWETKWPSAIFIPTVSRPNPQFPCFAHTHEVWNFLSDHPTWVWVNTPVAVPSQEDIYPHIPIFPGHLVGLSTLNLFSPWFSTQCLPYSNSPPFLTSCAAPPFSHPFAAFSVRLLWVNYNISLKWFPLLTNDSSEGEQRGRYNFKS